MAAHQPQLPGPGLVQPQLNGLARSEYLDTCCFERFDGGGGLGDEKMSETRGADHPCPAALDPGA